MPSFRFTSFLLVFLFQFSITLSAQHPGVRTRKDRQVKEDSMRQKLKRLADSIYELNGGKPAIPPEISTPPEPVPVEEINELPQKKPQATTLYWIAGGTVLLVFFLIFLTRKRKGQG